jgi:hypothetical protein
LPQVLKMYGATSLLISRLVAAPRYGSCSAFTVVSFWLKSQRPPTLLARHVIALDGHTAPTSAQLVPLVCQLQIDCCAPRDAI